MSDAAPSAAPEGGCLRGCVVYVTVTHSGGLSASVPFQNKCAALGAHVAKVMTKNVTHVVFRGEDAELSALHDRARKLSPESPPAFVTTLWVLACERDGRRPAERAYACPTPATTPRFGFFATPPGASRAASASSKRKARAMAPKSADAYDVDMEFFSSSQALKDEAEGLSRADSLKKRARANAAAARDAARDAALGCVPKDRRPGSDSKIAARARAAALASASAAAARPRPKTAGGGATRSSGGTLRTSRSLPRATTTTATTPSSAPAPKRARIARASAAAEAAAAASPVRPMRLPADANDGRDENENGNGKGGDMRGEVSGGGARGGALGGSREGTVAALTRRLSANVGRAVLASGAPSISSKGKSSSCIVAVSRGGDETEAMVRSVARELGGFRAAGPTEHDRATHLVLAEPRRTMRLLRAVARGVWVVTPEWARASAARGAWADPAEFETDAFPGARRARMARERGEIGAGKGLLGGVRVHVEERAGRPSAAELRALAAAAGGEIAPRGVDADVIVSSDGTGATGTGTGTGTGTRGGARDVVTEAWLLKAVADYELPRREDFRPR